MSTDTHSNLSQRKSGLTRLTIAVMFALATSFILLGGVSARRAASALIKTSNKLTHSSQQNQTPTPAIGQQSNTAPPENLPHQSGQAFAPETTSGNQVYISFDDVQSGTIITNQYPPAVFSTDPGHYTFADATYYYGSSYPNHLDRGPHTTFDNGGFHPFYVDFTTPVNDLRFYLVAVDDYRQGIAQLNIFQNHQLVSSRGLPGFGNYLNPILVNVGASGGGMGYDNVTRIEIVNITDSLGLSVDDFSFTIAPSPSPTPTPSPSPSPTPFPPTNLHGEGHIEENTLVWDLQAEATGYNVKRRASFESTWTVIATNVQPTVYTSFGDTTLIGRYRDDDAIPDVNYFYAVTAVNANGESADSNVISLQLEPSCGDFEAASGPFHRYYPNPGNGWSLTASVNGADGLVLSDVSLKGRYMAKMMSVPYFVVKTSKMPSPQRGELTANGDNPVMRSRLLRYSTPYGYLYSDGHIVETHFVAEYAVDRLTPTSKSCLLITQDYSFHDQHPGDQCEPSSTVPCARFYPRVSYKFQARAGETLESLNVAERLHYRIDGKSESTVGIFRDCNIVPCGPLLQFKYALNPVTVEGFFNVVKNGYDAGSWDNIHQTQFGRVDVPPSDPLHGVLGGCPDCVHTHWRWGAFFRNFPFYYPLGGIELVGKNPPFSLPANQDVDIGLVRYRPGEEHPNPDFTFLVNSESLRNPIVRYTLPTPRIPSRRYTVMGPADVLYWYSGTSYEPDSDLFFKHGSWFNPDFHQQMTVPNSSGSAGSSTQAVQDGIRSITYGHVYKDGNTTFSNVDPSTLAGLPAGYIPLDNRAYQITTDAIVSGPHVVAFDVPSINDQTVFNNLAVFHLEMDPFDPDNMEWVDDTILSPDTPALDFTNRIVNARVNDIGYFAIGNLVQPQPDPGSSDLSVTVNHSSSSVVVENNLSYIVHVANGGPQLSTGVGVIDALPQEATFVSASSSQGTCKYKAGSVYCKLGTLASGGSADVSIVVNTFEDKAGVPSQGRSIVNTAVVSGGNDDPNLDNNSATDAVMLLPNPNARPTIAITSPTPGATYTGPTANVSIAVTTTGSISKVDFYDGSTLIGTVTSGSSQYQLTWTASSGPHSIVAVATGTNGRTNSSGPVSIFVNGTATINITSPTSNTVFDPSSSITVTANTSGTVSKVEFFANSISLGEGAGGNPHSISWSNIAVGNYTLTAVVTDGSGAITTSAPVNVSVTSRPTITIVSPTEGMTYPLSSKVAIMATAQDSDGFVSKVDFYANGSSVGSGSFIGQDRFTIDWTSVPPGIYSLTAVATDNLGTTATSAPITIGVNTQTPQAGEFIWFDDSLPTGAVKHTESEDWYWVDANPGAFSGTKSHQSRNFGQVDPPNGFHRHYFDGATTTLPVNSGDKLFSYLFLDINNMPREIMLEWKDANGWEHRAYWGQNNISLGTDGTSSRHYVGPLPNASTWVRLEVPANAVGLEGSTLNGMSFALDGGRATWDIAGKLTQNAAPPPTTPPGDSVWIEDGLPAGAITGGVNDVWYWVPGPVYSGASAHQSKGGDKFQSHYFTGAKTPMQVNSGDVLFTYVYLGDPDLTRDPKTPDEIMLQFYDGTRWEHRAFWGENYIGQQNPSSGVQGTESQRFMGGLPAARGWYRLDVPASYVGLEGKSVSGMAFSVYRDKGSPFVTWDRSGKSSQLTTVPLPLSATEGVWQLKSSGSYYAYSPNDQGAPGYFPNKKDVFFVHPNQAPGTVPFYRFRRPSPNNPELFYSRSLSYNNIDWTLDGVAFYVFPDATTPGTVPLYLYHDAQTHYLLTINQNEAAGMTLDAIWAYVFANRPPIAPSKIVIGHNGLTLDWQDNSDNETAFRIEGRGTSDGGADINVNSVVGANVTHYDTGQNAGHSGSQCVEYRVRAENAVGTSTYASAIYGCNPDAQPGPPEVTVPNNGSAAPQNLAIVASSIDPTTAGTIAKIEFFANGSKLGEVTSAPYIFLWNNVPAGTYSLTATATNTSGGLFSPGLVLVDWPSSVDIVSPANGDVVDRNFAITANAFDIDGNGTIAKVEFFASGNKLGEVTSAPYVFAWNTVPPGTYSLTATVTDAAGASTTSAPVNVTVGKTDQSIAFDPITDKTYGDPPFAVSATASSGLPVSLSIVSGPATISGSTVTITGPGSVSVRADQVGNNTFNPAQSVTRSFNVAKATANVTLTNLMQTYDGVVHYASATTNPANLNVTFSYSQGGSTVNSPTNAGSYSITATVNDNNYQGSATGTLVINKATATLGLNAATLNQSYDGAPKAVTTTTTPAALGGVAISYNNSSTAPTNAGSYSVVGSLTNDNYTASNATGTLVIAKATPIIAWNNPADIVSGTALSSTQLNATALFGGNSLTGAFAYTPGSGTVLNVGNSQLLSTMFTPTDATDFNNATGTAHINVMAANAVSVANSGFETPVQAAGGYQYNPTGGSWNFLYAAGVTGNNTGFTSGNPPAPEGNQVAFLQVGSPISQTVSGFQANASYVVTFSAAQRGNCCGAGGQDLNVFLDDTLLGGFRPASTSYTDYSTSAFTTTAGAHTLKITGVDSLGGDNTAFIDNVRITTNSGLVAYWKFDENSGTTVADSSGSGHQGTLVNGTSWTTGTVAAALNFDGSDDMVVTNGIADVSNNFTLSFWALPSAAHEIDPEDTSSAGGTSGQRYAFWPMYYDSGHCGVGVSLGTNGISVYEHSAYYMPATLVYPTTITNWTYITIVYENKQPKLYVNGTLVRTGLTSPMSYVHLNPYYIGGQVYGYYAGRLDDVRIYNRALGANEVTALAGTSFVTNGSAQNVSWTNVVGLSASANNLTKTAVDGWGNAGAASMQTITSGDGYVEFTASERNTYRMCGLSHTDADQSYTSIGYALYLAADGNLYIYESGVYRASLGPYLMGDQLRVAVEGGTVKYRKNGALLYTSTVAPNYPLLVDTSLYSNGSTLNNVVVLR